MNFEQNASENNRLDIELLNKIAIHTNERICSKKLSCSSSMISQNGKIIWDKYFGYSDYDKKTPIKPHAFFRLMSMTKPITAVAIMKQCQSGKINLFDPIDKYLPQFKRMNIVENKKSEKLIKPAENKIRVIDLLTHTSGFAAHSEESVMKKIKFGQTDTLERIIPQYSKLELDFEPRTKLQYSAFVAFDILAHLVEKTSDLNFFDFLKQNIFEPLEIKDIVFDLSKKQKKRMVKLYTVTETGLEEVDDTLKTVWPFPSTYTSGGGGLNGTMEDYFRFASMLLNLGELENACILKQETVLQMAQPQLDSAIINQSTGVNWGLGMEVITGEHGYRKHVPIGAYGWSGAYGTHFWNDPKHKITAIYMSNLTTAGGSGAITAREFEADVYRSMKNK